MDAVTPMERLQAMLASRSDDYGTMRQLAASAVFAFGNEIDLLQQELDAWKGVAEKMYPVIAEIRGPLYDHDMHDWERKCDDLVEAFIKLREKKTREIMDNLRRKTDMGYDDVKKKLAEEERLSPSRRTQHVPCAYCVRGGNGDNSCSCGMGETRFHPIKGCFAGTLLPEAPRKTA